MTYLKCKDCIYFRKGFAIWNSCERKYDECVGAMSSACGSFANNEYTCGQCGRLRENGTCGYSRRKRFKNDRVCYEFKPKDDCFLTSACVEYMGLPDDCEELTALRSFRDGFLKNQLDGVQLIEEYYEIAPAILQKIKESGNKANYFNYIFGVITKCVGLLDEQKNEEVLSEYKNMVLTLKNKLL